MKIINYPLKDSLTNGQNFNFEFFEESFFESPEYQSIQDFQYKFTVYYPLGDKIKIIKAENGLSLRYFFILDNINVALYDHFLTLENSYLFQITDWQRIDNSIFEQIIKHNILLSEKTLIQDIKNINIGDDSIKIYYIRLTNNKNFIILLPKSTNYILNGLILKLEDCVPLEFIKAIDMII